MWSALSDERRGLLFTIAAGLASAVIIGSESRGLATIFYSLRFETSLFISSSDSQDYSGGILPLFHTGYSTTSFGTRLCYIYFARIPRKTPSQQFIGVFTASLPRNGRPMFPRYASAGICLVTRCLAMDMARTT
jgi:hypothetical protein